MTIPSNTAASHQNASNLPASKLATFLAQNKILLADGATGTNLFAMGLQNGESPELWNIHEQGKVAAHYDGFIQAGSDIILTNSFGGNRFRLALHQAENQVHEVNYQSANIALQQVKKSGRKILIAGAIGPTGELPEPMGALTEATAVNAFYEQALALKEGGADLLWVETMSSIEEAQWALQGVSQAGLECVCTFSFDTNGRSMMGVTPADAIHACQAFPHSPNACGANCGVGAADLVMAVSNMSVAQSSNEMVLVAKGNCGIPEYVDGDIVYTGTPEVMARYVHLAAQAGARIIGGCCGTTPMHVAAMRASLDQYLQQTEQPQTALNLEQVAAELGNISKGAQAQFAGDLSVAGGVASTLGAEGARTAKGKRRRRG